MRREKGGSERCVQRRTAKGERGIHLMRSQVTFSAILWIVGLIVMGGASMHPSQVSAQGTGWEHYMAEGAKAYQNGQETNAEMFYLAALEDVQNAGTEDPRLAATLNALANIPISPLPSITTLICCARCSARLKLKLRRLAPRRSGPSRNVSRVGSSLSRL